MNPQQIFDDIELVLISILNRNNYVVFGVVIDVNDLPRQIPKLYVWFYYKEDAIAEIFKRLNLEKLLLTDIEHPRGRYLYVYEVMN